MKTYRLADGVLDALDGSGSAHLVGDYDFDGCSDLLIMQAGAQAYPVWLVPTTVQVRDWPQDNWSVRLASCRTTVQLREVAMTLTPSQAALLFRTLPARVLEAWTGESWPAELSGALYQAVLERFEQEFDAGTVQEVPLDTARLEGPINLPQFEPVESGATTAARPGRVIPLGALGLHPAVARTLESRVGGRGLYVHQALALKYVRASRKEGADLILSTPTASGKTLSFLPGILEDLISHGGNALFLYPLTALCRDQFGTIEGVVRDLPDGTTLTLSRFIKDDRLGDTGAPDLIVGTPDKLNHNLHRPEIRQFLAGLRYVVLDEAHTYRGAFGTHMSAFLRRLLAVAGSAPTLIVSSATLKNTVTFARNLTGRRHFRVVGASTAPIYPRHLYLTSAPLTTARPSQAHRRAVSNLGIEVRHRRSKGVVFVSSRGATRQLANTLTRKEDDRGKPVAFPFHSNMKGYDEQLDRLRGDAGPMIAVSTSTLEAGIDIGDLDIVGILGFPRNRNSFKQMAGRAGRAGTAHVTFLPGTGPADQYYSRPESLVRLMTVESEPVHLNPYNPALLQKHIQRARYEMTLGYDSTGPALLDRLYPEGLPDDVKSVLDELFSEPPGFASAPSLRGEAGLAHLVLRTGLEGDPSASVPVVQLPEDPPEWLVERSSLENAHREWGPGNIVLRGGNYYRVLDWRRGQMTERSSTAPAVLVWIEDITGQIADPVEVARARRGLTELPLGAVVPHVHQASLHSDVTIGTVGTHTDGEFVSARAGRGAVTSALREKRERSEQMVTASCPLAVRGRSRLPQQAPERFHVTLRGPERAETLLGTYDSDRWPIWRSGRADIPGATAQTQKYYAVEEVRHVGGVMDLIVRQHEHDRELPGECQCGERTEARMFWESAMEALPATWSDHEVFSLVPSTFETDVAEITLRGTSLPALEALASALVKALPDVLEVDPQEVGVHAVSENGEARLLLWDTTVGGTGVSTAVPEALSDLLRGARVLLEESDWCVCKGAGCFGCIRPLTPLFWSHVPELGATDENDRAQESSATDAALAFLKAMEDSACLVVPSTIPVPAEHSALPTKLPFTQLLLSLAALVSLETARPAEGAEELLTAVLSSRLDVLVVTDLPHARAAELLENAFPGHAERLIGTLVADLRSGTTEPLRHLVPENRPEKLLWLGTSVADLNAAQSLNVSTALALWACQARALEAGPDLLIEDPASLLDALIRPSWHTWPLEQAGLSLKERSSARTVRHDVLGDSLEVFVLGRYAPEGVTRRHHRLRLASQHALSFKKYGTQGAEVARLIRERYPDHLVALVPSSAEEGGLGGGLAVLERSLQGLGHATMRLSWARIPQTRQKVAGGLQARVRNVADHMTTPPGGQLQGRRILVVDDIVTTGATLREALRALRAAGADVHCLAVAHTLLTGRGRA
ncbi:DEAD/DEAH box helicase [Deinococcus aquaticus]|uniref:DEAD/DEAH box helicase n=1 Tax=Deinococcus aquaticus TaxID=328692 RepID=UPI003F44993D